MSLFRRFKKRGNTNSNSIFSALIDPSDVHSRHFGMHNHFSDYEDMFSKNAYETKLSKQKRRWLAWTILLIVVFYLFHVVPLVISSYKKHNAFVETETWRRNECSDPVFFQKNKRLGSNLCDDVDSNEELIGNSAIYVALTENMPFRTPMKFLYQSISFVFSFEWVGQIWTMFEWIVYSRSSHEHTAFESGLIYNGRKGSTSDLYWFYAYLLSVVSTVLFIGYSIGMPFYYRLQRENACKEFIKECSACVDPKQVGEKVLKF